MENNIMNETEINKESLELAEKELFKWWFDNNLARLAGPSLRESAETENFLLQARETGTTIPMLSIGCQALSEEVWDREKTAFIPKNIDNSESSRLSRWVERLVTLQTALKSFGVMTHMAITLSDIQAIAVLIDLNATKDEMQSIERVLNLNNDKLNSMLTRKGANFTTFTHSDVIMDIANTDRLIDIMHFLHPDWKGEQLADFNSEDLDPIVASLLINDMTTTPQHLFGADKFIVIDMMSAASPDRAFLNDAFKDATKAVSIIELSQNGGNWNAEVEPFQKFDDKLQFINSRIGIGSFHFKNREEWLSRIQNTVPDSPENAKAGVASLQEFLNEIGIKIKVTDMALREQAIRIIEHLAFGESTFRVHKEEDKVLFDGTRLNKLIATVAKVPSGEARSRIKAGLVSVNGTVETDMNFTPQIGDVIKVGKKLNVKIVGE